MLTRLHSLTTAMPSIQLEHAASKHVYKIDSLNLILGESGAGKTALISNIIRHLCSKVSEPMFDVKGSFHKLGVVYYTASPFHQRMVLGEHNEAIFVDASPTVFPKDNDGSGDSVLSLQAASIRNAISLLAKDGVQSVFIVIDDADMLLDTVQQRNYVHDLQEDLAKAKFDIQSIQVLLCANSPLIASDVFVDAITVVTKEGHVPPSKIVGFTGTIQSVYNYTFSTPSIGKLAELTIQELQATQESKLDYSSGQKLVMNEICDDFIKRYLLRNK